MLTSFAVFAALVGVVAALSFAGARPARSRAMLEAFADAVRRCGLSLAASRAAAAGSLHGVDVRAELVQSRRGRASMRCVAALLPALGLGLVARGADDPDAARPASLSGLEVPAPGALTALALHTDLAGPLLAGPVGEVLCTMVDAGFEPRLRDATAEVWVTEPADADRLLDAIEATAMLASLAIEERRKLPTAERIRALHAALLDTAEDLELSLERTADAFEIRLEQGSIEVRLERNGTRAVTVLELWLDRPLSGGAYDHALADLQAISGVESVRITDDGGVVVGIGHVLKDSGELVPLVVALDGFASARGHDRDPYR